MPEYRLEQKPSTELKQKLSPRLIQSVKIMQLTKLELKNRIQQELEENPMLELDQEETEEEEQLEEPELEDQEKSLEDWERFYDGMKRMNVQRRTEDEEDEAPIEPIIESHKTFWETLHEQLAQKNLSRRGRAICEYIIGDLDERGFLSISTQEIADKVNKEEDFIPAVSEEEVEKFLKVVQTFEPPGIGARNLRESFLSQLEALNQEDTLAYKIVEEHFEDLKNKNSVKLAEIMDVPFEEIEEAKSVLASLSFSPAREEETLDSYIDPDLILRKNNGEWEIIYNYNNLPNLSINKNYYNLLKDKDELNEDTKDFLRKKFSSAKWWISSLNERRENLLSTMRKILERQREFFETNERSNLNPLKMQEVADALDLDVSTISRIVKGAYVQTSYGVFALRSFFIGKVDSKGRGEGVSTVKVKELIKDIIDNEDSSNPLSDNKISQKLEKEHNIEVSRRVINKYRNQMDIPSSRLRKKKG